MARPVIGIPCYEGKRAGTLRPFYGNNRAYVKAVEQAGGTPVLIPHFNDLTALEPLCARLDGLLLPGGADIHPHYYGEDAHPLLGEVDENEDRLDLELARYFLERDLPILGICRGVQLLNVATHGTLYQDLLDQRPNSQAHALIDQPRFYRAHPITIKPGTRLAEVMGSEPLLVNSLHHQAVKTTGRQVIVSATAPDGVVEGIELPRHRFAIGIQCHPEELLADGDERSLRLFQWFIQAAARASRWAEPVSATAADR